MKNRWLFLLSTSLAGVATLTYFAMIQRRILGIQLYPDPRAFAVPVFYGGAIGLMLGLRQLRLWQREAELKATVKELQIKGQELQATEEILRQQIEEHLDTHERLVNSERRLQEQNDDLLRTEEMLRVQIAESEESRQRLVETNQSLRTLFDVSPLPIMITSFPGGVVRELNHMFCGNFGYNCPESMGRTSGDIGMWVDGDLGRAGAAVITSGQAAAGVSAEMLTAAGERRSVLLYGNLIDYRGEACQVTVAMDVTEQKKMEDMLRQSQKMDVIGQLAGGVAHDYNNMLSAILGAAELVANTVREDVRASKLVATIIEAAARSADLTRQLLAFSRRSEGAVAAFNMNTAISSAISMLERTIDKKVSLRTRLQAATPCINGNETQVQNALLNLGVNARDAMPEGGTITFSSAEVTLDAGFCQTSGFDMTPGEFIEVGVSDSGTGISPELLPRIFEPFFTTKDIGKGTGLGLAAVLATVKQHHGCITISSELGTGTTFKLYLPITKVESTAAGPEGVVTCGSGGILVVDDEALIRATTVQLLEDSGYLVFSAESGAQALEVYASARDRISLVLLDMVMPGMGGKETLLQLKSRFPEVRVLISSGFPNEESHDELLLAGALGFIPKPFRKSELYRTVAAAIRNEGCG